MSKSALDAIRAVIDEQLRDGLINVQHASGYLDHINEILTAAGYPEQNEIHKDCDGIGCEGCGPFGRVPPTVESETMP